MPAGRNEPRNGLSVAGYDIAAPLPNPAQKEGEPAVGIRSRNSFFHDRPHIVVILPTISFDLEFASLRQHLEGPFLGARQDRGFAAARSPAASRLAPSDRFVKAREYQ